MHSYLKAIGFSKEKSYKGIEKLIKEVITKGKKEIHITSNSDEKIVEYKKEYGDGFGLIVIGYLDKKDEFHLQYYFPYAEGNISQNKEEVSIEKHISRNSFAGVCDDLSFGVSLIFYLQNTINYIKLNTDKSLYRDKPVVFSALSLEGKVLLPINKTKQDIIRKKNATSKRSRLIEAARKGDEKAIEILTIEDIDTYSKITRRLEKEDVFSIVDSSFMPYGIECDQYTIIGNILNVTNKVNKKTQEELVSLSVDCSDLVLEILINKEDLLGEPKVGRRFKGNIWMQGQVDFCPLS